MVPVFIIAREMGLVNSLHGCDSPWDLQSAGRILNAAVSPSSSGRDDSSCPRRWCKRVRHLLASDRSPQLAGDGFSRGAHIRCELEQPAVAANRALLANLFTVRLALEQFNSTNSTDYVGMVAMSVVAVASGHSAIHRGAAASHRFDNAEWRRPCRMTPPRGSGR